MTDSSNEVAQRTAATLAYVCAKVEQIREDLCTGAGGDEAPLDQLLAAIRDGGDLTGPLDRLHHRLQADGDAKGIYGNIRNGAAPHGLHPAGIDASGPPEIVYLCPVSQCSRYWWPQAAASVPQCQIRGEKLRRGRL
ncbi:hypothetical protein [Streptomyces sp. HUAS TT20]|uniref:hypothetical protein n=1 Tax=Streptomyces sp. HUAS TT20 TaxID=3447509 RepID=UPI0021DAE28F|nr:hypothetical protein [Streptomyces sp. HUAS 15-9]UXY25985.1 hypothetical protein N8I87_04945 [Streptomyces sp. HUAS 15-9]